MTKYKKIRVAVTVLIISLICAIIVYWDLESSEPAARIFTFLLGLACGVIPNAASHAMKPGANQFLSLLRFFLLMGIFFVGGLVLVMSDFWKVEVLGALPQALDDFSMIWNFVPAFFFSSVVIEAFHFYWILARRKNPKTQAAQEED